MANRARRTYREDLWKLTYGDDSGSELDSGSSADEEAELEHELQIFGNESSDEDISIEDSSVALVGITDTVTFTTSATTATATPGPVVATVSPSVSVPVATPAQQRDAGPSISFSAGSLYSTHQRTHVPAKRARVEPHQKTPKTTTQESCGKGGKNIKGGKRGKEPAATAAAVGSYLSYDDPDVGNPLPAFTPPPFTPSREPGFHPEVPHLRNRFVSPLDFFQLYFTPGLVDEIVEHTNTYAYIEVAKEDSSKLCYTEADGSWRDTSPNEILKLIGLLIYFGFVNVKGSTDLYWSTQTLFHGLWARSFMSRLRFRALMALLHVVDPLNEPAGNKLRKVLGFIDFLKGRFKALYQPRQHVAIDERMVKSRHRSSIRQYIRDKPIKWGIKYCALADSSNGYVVDFNIYSGRAQGDLSEYGLGYDVVRKLMQDYEGQGYHLFCDNFYSSITLARHLYEGGILYTGTILETRRDFPASLKGGKEWAKKKPRGAMRWERDPPVLALQWIDNKVVSMISTSADANDKVQVTRKTIVDQPQVFRDYNRFMSAVDRSNQILATHSVHQKSMRWWKAVFFDGIDTAIVNSYILFMEYRRKFPGDKRLQRPARYDLRDFKVELVRNIADLPKFGSPPLYINLGRPKAPRGEFEVEHCPIYVDEKRDCVVCRKRDGVRRQVYSMCSAPQCQGKHMHITKEKNCFQVFHTREFHGTQ
ncbi:PREDICTED: piggyBac transposable element-derived protein 4-like [Acropora digitifera]|uniref:piggyBac transposable element-derived protein 4-like n=1 Tax=Acropora digitifera TaxID=70779 RepID=UPI00077A7A82|nr:PREDICTED: piggyBac transposable element-derived protein 4-like [Acropora digitifera]XP_015754847.1 PREDICTED: piggyBac transposable element-derived protein 4-like [Acropora digitifera]